MIPREIVTPKKLNQLETVAQATDSIFSWLSFLAVSEGGENFAYIVGARDPSAGQRALERHVAFVTFSSENS